MEKKFSFVSGAEDCDSDMFEGLKEEWGELYKVEYDGSSIVRIVMGEKTLAEFEEAITVWGDELDDFETAEMEKLAVGEETELVRGRDGWYEVKRTA